MASQSPVKKNGSSSHLEPGAGGNGTILEGPAASWEVAVSLSLCFPSTRVSGELWCWEKASKCNKLVRDDGRVFLVVLA